MKKGRLLGGSRPLCVTAGRTIGPA